jgi:hypothetical protein
MPKRRRSNIIPYLLAGGHVWTPEGVFHETNLSYAPSDEPADRLFEWNRAVTLGGEHYAAWRKRHIAPIEEAEQTRPLRRWPGLAKDAQRLHKLREKRRKEWERQQQETLKFVKEREARELALLVEQDRARARKFYEDLKSSPAGEDAILHVQATLNCDRETAWREILKRF